MATVALVVAGGKGTRMGHSLPKQFIKIKRIPILYYTLELFQKLPEIDSIGLVVPKGLATHPIIKTARARFDKLNTIVEGGKRRQDSVCNGLAALDPDTEIVLIHDAVRPFAPQEAIRQSIAAARKCGAAIVAIPATDTIKRARKNQSILETLDRDTLWCAQTPQTFRFADIVNAYKSISERKITVTDDAQAMELCDRAVKIVMGSSRNIKITTQSDLILAKLYLSSELPEDERSPL